jgi:poly(A) polymerase
MASEQKPVERVLTQPSNDPRFSGARAVVERLLEAGHETYLVGGCVRDLALGRSPKDFDIATAATPDEVDAIFRWTMGVG